MKTLRNSMILVMLIVTSILIGQTKEVEFDVYTTSVTKATRYLLADDVALRDCPSSFCTQLTTLAIGTNVRLLEKSEKPESINGIQSRWYKIKMGPQVGWIWGGLISQKTLVGKENPEVKFVFGEAGFEAGKRMYQMRAVKNGKELDKMLINMETLELNDVTLVTSIGNDTVSIKGELINGTATEVFFVYKNDKFQHIPFAAASKKKKSLADNFMKTCFDQ